MPIRPVTDPSILAQLNHGGIVAPNAMFPGQVQAQGLGNQKTAFELKQMRDQASADTRIKNAQAIQEEQKAADAKFAAGDALGDPNLTGAARFASIPKDKQPMVRLLLDNNLQQLGGFALGKPALQSLISTAKAVDSSFDPSVFGVRYGAMRDFSGGGKNATIVGAAERLALNLQQLKSLSDKMGGPNVGFRPANALLASSKEAFEPKLSAGYDALLPEIANQFDLFMKTKGTPTVSGTDEVMKGLKRGQSQDERNAAIEQVVKAIRGGLEPIKGQWQSAYGGNSSPPMWISPEAAKFYGQIDPDHTASYNPNATHGIPGLHGQPGETPPPSTPLGPAFAPTPSGPTNGMPSLSANYNETSDPQSAAFWENAARQGTPYREALGQWQDDAKTRGMVGMTPPSPGPYHKAAAYIRDHPNTEYHPFQAVTRTPTSPIDSAMTAAADNGPVQGAIHFTDSALANLPTRAAGEQGDKFQAVSNAQHPNWSFAGDLGGTVAGAIGTGKLLKAAAPALGPIGNALTKTPGRIPLAGDVLFGATSGAARNPDNPILAAILGGETMAAGNVVGRGLLGPAIRGGYRAADALGFPVDAPPALASGDSMVLKRTNPVIDQIRGNLQDASNLNLPYSMADADPRLRLLAGSAARKSPDVRATAENIFGPRQLGQGERSIAQINSNLAPVGDVSAIKTDALTRARQVSAPLYKRAMTHPVPDDAKINEMLDTPAGQAAARNGYAIALHSGESPGEISFSTRPDGGPILNAKPNWKTLQYIKMGMDKVVTDNQNPVTGKLDLSDPANKALNDLRSRFVTRLGDLNPDYKAANARYSGVVGQGTAAERGAAATSARVTPEQTAIAVTKAGDNLPFFQRGYASDMADQVERSRMSGNPYNLIYGSLGQQAKLGAVFPEGAANFARAHSLESDMGKTGTELFGGSQTQPRAEADKMFDHPLADMAPDIAFGLATGVPPPSLIKRGLGTLARDSLRLGVRGTKDKADRIGQLLLNPDPAANLAMLDELSKIDLARRGYVQRTNSLGGLLTAPLIYGAVQNR